jgi:hypothetical protein
MCIADDFDNHYDISDGDGYHDQEEAHFYWTLREFETLVTTHGAGFIIAEMDSSIVDLLKEKLNVQR